MSGRIVVGLSGGVDSAVAALLLRDAGHDVQGLFMVNWDADEDGRCTAAADFQEARRVTAELEIPLHRVSFAREYQERVFARFLAGLRAGLTPNPDVLCNREIKFGVCLQYARRLGADRFATGHYARIGAGGTLLRGLDPAKDQSYFLHALSAAELDASLFPLGELHKAEVRAMARERGLPVHDRRDSTGICFIGERPFAGFLARWLEPRPGPIRTLSGELLGEHQGLAIFTLGQRSGLGIGGRRGSSGAPWYVAGKDLPTNTLLVVQGRDHPVLFSSGLHAGTLHWISGQPPAADFRCTARVRYRQADVACAVSLAGGQATVHFAEPVHGATPGQYIVFYQGEECLGGGVIETLLPAERRAAA